MKVGIYYPTNHKECVVPPGRRVGGNLLTLVVLALGGLLVNTEIHQCP